MSDPAFPAWAREEAFPCKPETAPYGICESSGKTKTFDDFESLRSFLSKGKGKPALIWVPEEPRLITLEEYPRLGDSIRKRQALFARYDAEDAKRGFLIFGLILGWTVVAAYTRGGMVAILHSQTFGIAALLFLLFALRPWYEAYRGRKQVATFDLEALEEEVPEARFESWLERQRTPVTYILLGMVSVVGLVQFLAAGDGIAEAGLVKEAYAAGQRERLFTAPFLHGNVLHFLMNASALWFLGRRVEVLARWPHLAMVFLVSILGAGWATVTWMPQTSVGISGVVCGFLGFLLVFETLHRPLVPRSARRRLAGILISLVVIGSLGFAFIDNAAHLGGLVAGAAYAGLVFPKSSSPQRPKILGRDLLMGGVAGLIAVLSAGMAIWLILNR